MPDIIPNVATPARPEPIAKELQIALIVDSLVVAASTAMKRSYDGIRRQVYTNPAFTKWVSEAGEARATGRSRKTDKGTEVEVFDPEAAYVAILTNTKIKLTAESLGGMARVNKAAINMFESTNKIVDEVPEATITL
jgi:hypothetical protein